MTCPVCSVCLPRVNYQLHQIRCSKLKESQQQQRQQQQQRAISANANQTQPKASNKKNKKKKSASCQAGSDPKNAPDKDIDALLDNFAEANSKCHSKGCKTSIKTLGQKCSFCTQMFCLSHSLAEVHGCGEAARVQARRDISKYHDSKPQPMNKTKKAQVQHKLTKKLSEMEDERKRKSKSNKK